MSRRFERQVIKVPAGFTLVELVIVIVVLSILALYAAMRGTSTGEATLSSQSEQLARDIRHLQMLAATKGQHLQLRAAPAGYSVACVPGGPNGCDGTADFSVTLTNIVLAGPATQDFDSLGRPVSSAASTYTLSAGSSTVAVTVSPITGFVAVTPQ